MADKDGDLIATKEEFTAFLHPEEYDYMKDIVVQVGGGGVPGSPASPVLMHSLRPVLGRVPHCQWLHAEAKAHHCCSSVPQACHKTVYQIMYFSISLVCHKVKNQRKSYAKYPMIGVQKPSNDEILNNTESSP